MTDDKQQAAAPDPLTAWWFGVLPALFGAWAAPFTGGKPDDLQAGAPAAAPASIAHALQPLATNLERAYGGVADAFGLAPLRELAEASRDWSAAVLEQRRAHAAYFNLVLGAAGQGLQTLTRRLAEKAGRGESVDTLLALARLWASATDEALHATMQSPPALQASAEVVRASTRARQQQQRVVATVSEALNVPTRAEVDDAYREIQQLKRELRRLRKQVEATASPPALPPPEDRKPPKPSSSRANGAAAA